MKSSYVFPALLAALVLAACDKPADKPSLEMAPAPPASTPTPSPAGAMDTPPRTSGYTGPAESTGASGDAAPGGSMGPARMPNERDKPGSSSSDYPPGPTLAR